MHPFLNFHYGAAISFCFSLAKTWRILKQFRNGEIPVHAFRKFSPANRILQWSTAVEAPSARACLRFPEAASRWKSVSQPRSAMLRLVSPEFAAHPPYFKRRSDDYPRLELICWPRTEKGRGFRFDRFLVKSEKLRTVNLYKRWLFIELLIEIERNPRFLITYKTIVFIFSVQENYCKIQHTFFYRNLFFRK